MKKYFIFLLVFAFLFTFTAAPKNVTAFVLPSESEVWEWYAQGVSGEEISIITTPGTWYQQKANALKVDGATRICHGFDDGRYGWTGEIFRLVGDAWVKLPTTVGWVPTEEGHYMACAVAPAAGTYALFGYFVKANAPVKEIVLHECVGGSEVSLSGYEWTPPNNFAKFQLQLLPAVAGIRVFVKMIPITGSFSGFSSGTFFSDGSGTVYVPNTVSVNSIGPFEFHIRFTTPTCFRDIVIKRNS